MHALFVRFKKKKLCVQFFCLTACQNCKAVGRGGGSEGVLEANWEETAEATELFWARK